MRGLGVGAQNMKKMNGRDLYKSKVYVGVGEYKYVYAKTQKELKAKITDLKAKLGKGIDISSQRDSFSEWQDRWLKTKKHEISSSKYENYTHIVKHLHPLSNMQISKIRTMDIQDILYDMGEGGYAKSTINSVKLCARAIMQFAVDNRIIDYNPVNAVKMPRTQLPTNPHRCLTDEEQTWIVSTPHRAQRASMIMLYAGLRRAELIALLWTDIDLTNNTITITKSTEKIKNDFVVKQGAKTDAGNRIVYIPQILADFLRAESHDNNFIVCPSARGSLHTPSSWRRLWESYLYEINKQHGDKSKILQFTIKNKSGPDKIPMVIDKINPHDLRHTYATILYKSGVDVLTAKDQLGHADIQTTMQIYTHLDKIFKENSMARLNDFLGDGGTMGVQKIK